MYNLKKIRENNTIRLYASMMDTVVYNGVPCVVPAKSMLFKAEVPPTSDLRLDFKANIDTPYTMSAGPIVTAAANAIQMAPALDIPAKFAYRGSSPITFTVPCILVLRTDPQKDIVEPLNNLMKLMLPSRGEELTKYLSTVVNSLAEMTNAICSYLGWDPGISTNTKISDFIGDVYTLNAPWPYGILNGENRKLSMRIGALRFEGIVIESVSIAVPTMLYEQGWPDHISLSLSIRSLRPATVDQVSSMFTPMSSDAAFFK